MKDQESGNSNLIIFDPQFQNGILIGDVGY